MDRKKEIEERLASIKAECVAEDNYDEVTHTRTITKIKKVYDVSAVDLPANPNTDISARWCGGVAESEKVELLERDKKLKLIKILTEV